jgi:hypothetical protein
VRVFSEGLKRHGYAIEVGLTHAPRDGDLLVTWNRIGPGETSARQFERQGLPVLVAENASWGNEFGGGHWYSIARGVHNTAGRFDEGGPERWDSLGVALHPQRVGGELVILPQRGIGSAPTRMPGGWPAEAQARWGGRVRAHPGRRPCKPLWDDLEDAGVVVTWGSGAAILATLWGLLVHSEMPDWIGAQDNTDAGRLAMFRRLAWAQWRLAEIESGEAFARLLEGS